MRKKPTLENFDAELKKYVAIEASIQKIAPVHNIGALSLETAPLKYSLKSEASSWKSQYSANLHEQGKTELDTVVVWMEDMQRSSSARSSTSTTCAPRWATSRRCARRRGRSSSSSAPSRRCTRCSTATRSRSPRRSRTPSASCRTRGRSSRRPPTTSTTGWSPCRRLQEELVRNVKAFVADVLAFRNEWEASGPTCLASRRCRATSGCSASSAPTTTRSAGGTSTRRARALRPADHRLPRAHQDQGDRPAREGLRPLHRRDLDRLRVQGPCERRARPHRGHARQGGRLPERKKMPKKLREYEAFVELKRTIDDFLETLPLGSSSRTRRCARATGRS